MDADDSSSEEDVKPLRYPSALPKSGKLMLDERTKGDVGVISSDLLSKLFRIHGRGEEYVNQVHSVALAPWQPPTPQPEAACTWTIVSVKVQERLDSPAIIQLPTTCFAAQRITKAFQKERPDVKSLKAVDVLVLEVQPLTLSRVFVRLDGDALRRHAEVQKKFGGGFVPEQTGIAAKKGKGKALIRHDEADRVDSDEFDDRLKEQVITAVCQSLSKSHIIRCNDVYPLPLPTHPITHASFPPIETIICEPVDQGFIADDTEIVVDIHMRRQKSKKTVERPDQQSNGVALEESRTRNLSTHAAQGDLTEKRTDTDTSDSEDDESSTEDSDDDLTALSSTILPSRISGHASPGSMSTPRQGRGPRSGASSPGSTYSAFTMMTANQRSHLGKPFRLAPLHSRVPDHMLHPRPGEREDDEARLFVDVKLLARLGCFSGDWVRLSIAPKLSAERDPFASLGVLGDDNVEEESRTLKIYGIPNLAHGGSRDSRVDSGRRSSLSSIPANSRPVPTAFLSPILYATLDQPGRVYLSRISLLAEVEGKPSRRKLASTATPPTAKKVTLTKLSTPISTEKAMQPGIVANLKAHFEDRRRILKTGDKIAITFDILASRIVADMSPSEQPEKDFSSLLVGTAADKCIEKDQRGLPIFRVGRISTSSTEEDGEATDSVWHGSVCIEPEHTKMIQAGNEYETAPPTSANPWPHYMGLSKSPSKGGPILSGFVSSGAEKPFTSVMTRRVQELLFASTTLQAVAWQLRPFVLLIHSSQRGAGKMHTTSTACANLGLHLFRIDAYDILTEGGEGGDVKTEGTLRARIDRALTCGEMCTVPAIRHVDALSSDRIALVLKEILENIRVLVLTTLDLSKVSEGVRNLVTHELEISAPNETERRRIMQSCINDQGLTTALDVDLRSIARRTAAMAAGDLVAVIARAAVARRRRLTALTHSHPGTLVRDVLVAGGDSVHALTAEDLESAVDSARKSFADALGAPKIPHVSWDDVGGLAHAKHAILETIRLPREHPELFAPGLKKRSGILLYGPPGTGKTLLAKAIATSFSLNFFSVKGPELLNMYIGESEANVRRVFARARDARPCVVFFDELDAVAPKRGGQGDSGGVMDRMVSQLLAELDGMSQGKTPSGTNEDDDSDDDAGAEDGGGVFVVGATNRPDLLDPALLRPGRFDKMLYLGVAETHAQQMHILEALTRKFVMAEDIDLAQVAERLPFTYTGADLYALCADAMLKAMMRRARAVEAKIQAMPGEPKMTPATFFDKHATEADIKVVVEAADFRAAQSQLTTSVRYVFFVCFSDPAIAGVVKLTAHQCQRARALSAGPQEF